MTLEEIKSKAYDAIVQLEQWQKILANLNQQIRDWKEPVKKEEPKKE